MKPRCSKAAIYDIHLFNQQKPPCLVANLQNIMLKSKLLISDISSEMTEFYTGLLDAANKSNPVNLVLTQILMMATQPVFYSEDGFIKLLKELDKVAEFEESDRAQINTLLENHKFAVRL
jgi:hypothetical protein